MAKLIVTGGAGFIGCNVACRFLKRGDQVVAVDDLSRAGTDKNLEWLRGFGDLAFERLDVRDMRAMEALIRAHEDADAIIHLAGQVAVTTSVSNPMDDFKVNAQGSLNLLEAVRQSTARPLLIYASTNKVYGGMESIAIKEEETRYAYRDYPLGIPETAPLDFHSPYGCSKGAADQYFHDYARIYGLPTVVCRQSCIYGTRQFGVEDQGWVAWFVIAAAMGRPISIYGNGKQVRDILYIDDLIDAYITMIENKDAVSGQVYNIGGGPEFTMSIWAEFGAVLERLFGAAIPVTYGEWRPGDQPIYVSDIRKVERDIGWRPATSVEEGTKLLADWVRENKSLF